MKRFNLNRIVVAITMMLIGWLPSLAHDFEVDGIFYNKTSDNTVAVTYKGEYPHDYSNEYAGDVVIPSSVKYNGVTYSVTSIGYYAFSSCESLTSIQIPDSVTSIGYYAFSSCESLTSIQIPDSVTSIGDCAFSYCTSLTSIEIPNSVTSIGDDAFGSCSGLTSIVVDAGNTKYDSRNGCNAIIETASNTLIVGCQNTIIPNSVTGIGEEAFYNCTSLTSIEIPNSVTSIGRRVFFGCADLTSIVVDYGNAVYDSRYGSNAIIETASNTLIVGCQNTIIPNSVTSIGNNAFSDCESLTSIEIPNSVTSIGDEAFSICSGLTSIEIPNSVTSIGYGAFSFCTGLTSIEIPNNVTSIGDYAFYDCESLTSIEIPNSVTSIGDAAFYSCSSLTSIVIPNSVTSIGQMAFWGCSSLTSVVIGNSVTSIGDRAFYYCSSLTKITCLAINPPAIESDSFTNYSTDLYVPIGCKSAYESAEYWKNFNNILEFSSSANFLSGKPVNTYSGASERVSVEMTNEQAITAFQCDIYLPDGISVATIDGEYDINLSSRAKSSHSLSCVEQSDGSIRLLCYSMSLATFSGNEGELFDINFNISKEIEGNYQVLIDNIVLTDKAQNEYKSSAAIIDFNVKAYMPADVNNDGSINVTDVVATASYILGLDTKKFIFEAADMNKDGVINVTDIVGIASIILNGGSASNVSSQRCAPNTSDVIKIEDFAAGKNKSQQVAIGMTNASDYSAFQMDIRLPKGMSIAECELASAATDHMVAYRELPDGAVRVLVYSLTCRTLPNCEEGIIRLRTATDNRFEGGEIVVENILFADRGQNEYRLYDSVANVNLATGVSATDMDCVVYAENRSIVIISPCDQQATISSVDGVSRTYTLNEGRNEIAAPQAGVYIVTLADRTFKVMVK